MLGARGSVVGWAGRSQDRISMKLSFFNSPNPSSRTMALGRPARKADNLTAICEPIVYKMWEPRCLTTLWASTASYRDTFTFTDLMLEFVRTEQTQFWIIGFGGVEC
jgi:hypothetical protein